MERKILEFIDILRGSGIRVALSESIDCFRALEIQGLEKKAEFKSAMRSTLVKRMADIPLFEKMFDMYFSSAVTPSKSEDTDEGDAAMLPFGTITVQEFVESFLEENHERYPNIERMFDWQLGGDFQVTLMRMGAESGLSEISNPLQVGFFSKKIRDRLAWSSLREEIQGLREELSAAGYADREIEDAIGYLEERMKSVFEAVREYVKRELEMNMLEDVERLREEELLDKNFYQLSQREVEMIRDIVARLGKKLRDRLILRNKRRNRGRIDVKRVFRRNMQYGGVPIELCFKNRRREKPQIFALCDISDSVNYSSRFMLQFLYTLQELFAKVRTFVFVTEIAEVTRLFSEHEINAAIHMSLHSRMVDYNGHSNFGYAFQRFRNEFLESVTPRTTIIVMGDARNNRNDPRVWAFREMAERAKRVIWLNPESRPGWRLGDSVMYEYLPYCDEVHECRNANQLLKVVDDLLVR